MAGYPATGTGYPVHPYMTFRFNNNTNNTDRCHQKHYHTNSWLVIETIHKCFHFLSSNTASTNRVNTLISRHRLPPTQQAQKKQEQGSWISMEIPECYAKNLLRMTNDIQDCSDPIKHQSHNHNEVFV